MVDFARAAKINRVLGYLPGCMGAPSTRTEPCGDVASCLQCWFRKQMSLGSAQPPSVPLPSGQPTARPVTSDNDRVVQLAHDMASYVHHSGYPRYDGGHSEPEEQCAHPDCAAVRAAQLKTTDYAQYLKNFPNDEPRD
jgi:hypothetical protein